MRFPSTAVLLLLLVAGCEPATHRVLTEPSEEIAPRPFRPTRMRAALPDLNLSAVRTRLSGDWKFRVTVVGFVEEVAFGYFTDYDERDGIVSVRLPSDAAVGQTWEVVAAFDQNKPTQREGDRLVWRFARPAHSVRMK